MSQLRDDILTELDEMVCTKHPPGYDIDTVADNIVALVTREIDRQRAEMIAIVMVAQETGVPGVGLYQQVPQTWADRVAEVRANGWKPGDPVL